MKIKLPYKKFGRDYWLKGKGSCYTNFRYMPEKCLPRAAAFAEVTGMSKDARILDYGCGMGTTTCALLELGYHNVIGIDLTAWPIKNCVPGAKGHVQQLKKKGLKIFADNSFDLVIAKDVFEHVPLPHLKNVVNELMRVSPKLLFLCPVADEHGNFICPRDEDDVTHITRLTKEKWLSSFPYQATEHNEVLLVVRGKEHAHGSVCVLLER